MTDMKHIKFGVIALLIFGMVIFTAGIVCADQGVNATPETQSLGTTTTVDVVGLVMETDAGTWTLTNDPVRSLGIPTSINDPIIRQWPEYGVYFDGDRIRDYNLLLTRYNSWAIRPNNEGKNFVDFLADKMYGTENELAYQELYQWLMNNNVGGGGIHTGALDPGQIQYTTAYDANIVAQGGQTSFVKQMNLHTGNKVISQSNLIAKTGLAFAATSGGGNVVGSENLMLDGAGMNTTASDKLLCPFAAGIANAIPAYCNIVQAGSKYDLTIGSVTTQADNAFVHSDATIPVVLNYNINVKPYSTTQGQVPASGSTSAYIKAHIQEARGNGTAKAEDLVYSETSSASGRITAFNKLMSYSSQITGPTVVNHVIHASVGTIGAFGNGGSVYISPIGDIQVPEHTSITFTMGTGLAPKQISTPFGPASVLVDGVDVGDLNSYTFQDVTSDHTIVARPLI
jgi:hypothetical protein